MKELFARPPQKLRDSLQFREEHHCPFPTKAYAPRTKTVACVRLVSHMYACTAEQSIVAELEAGACFARTVSDK